MSTTTMSVAPAAHAQQAPSPFESSVPYTGEWGDALVIYCTDPRYRRQTHELLHDQLGLQHPAVITVPGGVAVLLPLVGIAHKLVKGWLDLLFAKHRPRRIVCVAHQDCAAYGAAKHPVLNFLVKAATGHAMADLQQQHLRQAQTTLATWFPGIPVETYFAEVKAEPDGSHRVAFTPVT